jgi:hypothetical protein
MEVSMELYTKNHEYYHLKMSYSLLYSRARDSKVTLGLIATTLWKESGDLIFALTAVCQLCNFNLEKLTEFRTPSRTFTSEA